MDESRNSGGAAERPLETGWLADTPVSDSLLRRFLVNQAELQDHLVGAVSGRTERHTDVALTDSGLPIAYLNQAVLLRPLTGTDDSALDEIAAFYHGSVGLVVSAWPTPDLEDRGWQLVGHPMLVVRSPGRFDPAVPEDVQLRIAGSADELALVERILAAGYPLPELDTAPPNAALGAALIDGPVRHRLGYLDGAVVAAAASHVAHGVVNLCLAATLPAARRRGVWQALVEARSADAPDFPSVAITSDYSRPGFVRIGFLPIMRFTLWVVRDGKSAAPDADR